MITWGDNTYGQTNVPSSATNNVMAIVAGGRHSVALRSDRTVVAWGDDSDGQTDVVRGLPTVKTISAGDDFTLAAVFSPMVEYPVNVANDLLLIYNTNSIDSSNVMNYYIENRPMVANANVLGIGHPPVSYAVTYTDTCIDGGVTNTNSFTHFYTNYYEDIAPVDMTNQILAPVQSWLNENPTKRPAYVILFLDVPSKVNTNTYYPANGSYPGTGAGPSVQYYLNSLCAPGWAPFVTSINMGGANQCGNQTGNCSDCTNAFGGYTNDCIGYINKVTLMAQSYSPGRLMVSASLAGYGNTNYVVDNIRNGPGFVDDFSGSGDVVYVATNGLIASGVSADAILYYDGLNIVSNGVAYYVPHPTGLTNLAGYISWGAHGSLGGNYSNDGLIQWKGNSGWWIIETVESFNGQRIDPGQGTFIKWFSSDAFGGTGYSNTPIGAVTHVDEPGLGGVENSKIYFGLWAAGKNFAICAWNSLQRDKFQAVGDPFVQR